MEDKEKRKNLIKKIILWSVIAGGIIALFIPLLNTGSIKVLAACTGGSLSSCVGTCGGDAACIDQCNTDCDSSGSGSGGGSTTEAFDICSLGPCIGGTTEITGDNPTQGIANIVFPILNVAIYIGAAISVVMIAWGAWQWMTGAGIFNDKGDKTGAKGKETIMYAVIGLIALGLLYIIIPAALQIGNMINNMIRGG